MSELLKKVSMLVVVLFVLCGCQTTETTEVLPESIRGYKQPTIAVLDFENKAGMFKEWKLGSGFSEILVNELIKSKRYNVVTRYDIDSVISELQLQKTGMMNKYGKAKPGQLKNVQYLIKGTVTDFSHVAGGTLRWIGSSMGIGGDGSVAQVSVILSVIKVETGEIIDSVSLSGTATASSISVKGHYDGMGFGGSAFRKTPLGEATTEVIEKCLKEITASIAKEKWSPKVMKLDKKMVYITGGKFRGLKVGNYYQGFKRGEALVDPENGSVLGYEESTYYGKIEVLELFDKYAKAAIIDGTFEIGDTLIPLEVPTAESF